MEKSSYLFKLGDFNCWVLNDGECSGPDSVQDISGRDLTELDYSVLLVKTGINTTLVDTGWGVGAEAAPQAGLMIQNLKGAGVQPGEIDNIIFSHAHIDHIGGHIDSSGNLIFPRARFHMFKKEWEFWTNQPDLSSIPEDMRQSAILAVQKNLNPLKDKINLFENSGEILPGISYMATPGHSPGHIILIISSGSQRLVCLFDSFHRPMEIDKPTVYLTSPMTNGARASREKILSQIRSDDLIYGGHFPFPGLGHIIRKDKGSQWQAITIK
jgi:glyoxylase-like metal-dependent hydrolase (beta-lactamase superfamily II)